MKENKKVFKFFIAGEEGKESKWLSEQAKLGYHLKEVKYIGYYVFEKGKEDEYDYIIDYKENGEQNEQEYKQLYTDLGLDYVLTYNGYYYFKGENIEQIEQIKESDKSRYIGRLKQQRNTTFMLGFLNIFIFFASYLADSIQNKNDHTLFINLFVGCIIAGFGLLINSKINKIKTKEMYEEYVVTSSDFPLMKSFQIISIFTLILYIISLIMSILVN